MTGKENAPAGRDAIAISKAVQCQEQRYLLQNRNVEDKGLTEVLLGRCPFSDVGLLLQQGKVILTVVAQSNSAGHATIHGFIP